MFCLCELAVTFNADCVDLRKSRGNSFNVVRGSLIGAGLVPANPKEGLAGFEFLLRFFATEQPHFLDGIVDCGFPGVFQVRSLFA